MTLFRFGFEGLRGTFVAVRTCCLPKEAELAAIEVTVVIGITVLVANWA